MSNFFGTPGLAGSTGPTSMPEVKRFSFYNRVSDTRPAKGITLDALVDMARNPSIGLKERSAALTPYQAEGKTTEHAKSAQYYALVMDHDDDDLSRAEVVQLYGEYGCGYLAFTTSSHQQDKGDVTANRWKVVIPLAKPVDQARYLELAKGLALVLGTDDSQARAAQVFYAPNKLTDDAPYDYIDKTGQPRLDPLDDDHPLIAEAQAAYQQEQEQRRTQAKAKVKQRSSRTLEASNGVIEKVLEAYSVRDVLKSFGYLLQNDKYLPPNSTSGIPGVVILESDGREVVYSHHSATSDPLSAENHGGHALDVFDVIVALKYEGDFSRAIAELANDLDPEGQKQRQREYMENKADNAEDEFKDMGDGDDDFDLSKFSLLGKVGDMETQMLEDTFVLDGIAIRGQITVLYAKPNAGKTLLTLRLLIDSIERMDVDGANVFYINADDNYKGLITKLKLAEQYEFHMLAPGHEGFDSDKFASYLEKLVENGKAADTIIVLDTLKKFTDLMDKKAGSRFMKYVREFASHGGTVIALAHTNKHKGEDGKLVFGGTSDVVDDADCAYMIDALDAGPLDQTKTVVFENFKSRGDVTSKATYRYSIEKGQHYSDLVGSVEKVSGDEAEQAQQAAKAQALVDKNQEIIDVLLEAMGNEKTAQVDLVKAATEAGLSRRAVTGVIKHHAGESWSMGHRWRVITEDKNAKFYQRLEPCDGAASAIVDFKDCSDEASLV